MPDNLLANFIAALLFAILGIVVLLISFVTLDLLTPYSLWKEIVDQKKHRAGHPGRRHRSRHLDHHRGGDPLSARRSRRGPA